MGAQILEHTWTQTPGYGEHKKILKINIRNNFQGITSLNELYEKKHRNKHIFLEKLKIKLEKKYQNSVDPIQYLYHLYYVEKLSTIEIYDRLYMIGNYDNKHKNTFEIMFKTTFGWELRGNTEPSTNTKKRQSKNNGHKGIVSASIQKINQERVETEQNEIKILYSQIDTKKRIDGLLLIDLENKKTLNQKIIYILYSLGFLEKENDEELAKFIKNFQDRNIGFLKTAQIIKGLILKIKPELKEEINEENLKKRLREKYNKYYSKK